MARFCNELLAAKHASRTAICRYCGITFTYQHIRSYCKPSHRVMACRKRKKDLS